METGGGGDRVVTGIDSSFGKKKKILVVDDEKLNISIVADILSDEFEVFFAMSGDAALSKLATQPVDLVLLDVLMPEMDGFTLTRNIKKDDRFKGLPVIIHSSLSGTTNEDHVRSVGADAYVAKFVAEELAATIREVVAN
mgnify:CR=1 FL=1